MLGTMVKNIQYYIKMFTENYKFIIHNVYKIIMNIAEMVLNLKI